MDIIKLDNAYEHYQGLRSKIPGIIDDCCNYIFDPAYTIDKDGNMRITEISLIRKPAE